MLPSIDSIITRLKVRHFRLLVAIEDTGSLLKAADQISVSQPAATKALQEIEAAVGASLFLRTTRGVRPNELGKCVIRHARLICEDLVRLREDMKSVLEGSGGHLAVGTIMGAVPLLTGHLTRLLVEQPTLRVELVEDTSARLLEFLDKGRLDVAICRTSVSSNPDLYSATLVSNEQLAVVANAKHPLAERTSTLADVAHCRWIVYASNMPMRRYLEQEFHAQSLAFPRTLIETTSAFATLSLLQRNVNFVALLSTEVADVLNRTMTTTTLKIALPARSEAYYLVARKDRPTSPAAKMFCACILDERNAN